MIDKLLDWIGGHPFEVLVICLLMFMAAIGGNVYKDNKRYKEFMDACERDHKHYECLAMYRGGLR